MPFKPGQPSANPSGRPKGATNKLTRDVKAAITKALEDSAKDFSGWLKSVGEDDPARALDIASKLAEYTIPKLARSEVSGPDGDPLTIQIVTLAPKE